MDEAPDTNDREEGSDDLDAQQRRGVDQLTGPWSGTLRVILVAAAAILVVVAAMMAYSTWNTYRIADAQLERANALLDEVEKLYDRTAAEWEADREGFEQQMQALHQQTRSQLRGDADELRRALQDTLRVQAAVAQRLRRDLERAVGLAQDMKAASERYTASISEGQVLNERMRASLRSLEEEQPARRETGMTISRVVSENLAGLPLAGQLLFFLVAEALLYPEDVPQLKFDIGYRWYLLREYDTASRYFQLASAHKDQLTEFARNNVDRLLRASADLHAKQQPKAP